jgi:hypothetical protein
VILQVLEQLSAWGGGTVDLTVRGGGVLCFHVSCVCVIDSLYRPVLG